MSFAAEVFMALLSSGVTSRTCRPRKSTPEFIWLPIENDLALLEEVYASDRFLAIHADTLGKPGG